MRAKAQRYKKKFLKTSFGGQLLTVVGHEELSLVAVHLVLFLLQRGRVAQEVVSRKGRLPVAGRDLGAVVGQTFPFGAAQGVRDAGLQVALNLIGSKAKVVMEAKLL